jgi:hypothetical protein
MLSTIPYPNARMLNPPKTTPIPPTSPFVPPSTSRPQLTHLFFNPPYAFFITLAFLPTPIFWFSFSSSSCTCPNSAARLSTKLFPVFAMGARPVPAFSLSADILLHHLLQGSKTIQMLIHMMFSFLLFFLLFLGASR